MDSKVLLSGNLKKKLKLNMRMTAFLRLCYAVIQMYLILLLGHQ